MFLYSKWLARLVYNWPGRKYLGEYRFLPIFFGAGATIEYLMIHWHSGEVNFYKTYKRRRVEELVEERLRQINAEQSRDTP